MRGEITTKSGRPNLATPNLSTEGNLIRKQRPWKGVKARMPLHKKKKGGV